MIWYIVGAAVVYACIVAWAYWAYQPPRTYYQMATDEIRDIYAEARRRAYEAAQKRP